MHKLEKRIRKLEIVLRARESWRNTVADPIGYLLPEASELCKLRESNPDDPRLRAPGAVDTLERADGICFMIQEAERYNRQVGNRCATEQFIFGSDVRSEDPPT